MDPSRQWQQPDPSRGGYPPQPPYGPPQPQPQYPQPPQYPQQQPQQYPQQPQYPPQPQPQYPPRPQPAYPPTSAQPYSALPYASQPYSAPPAYPQTQAYPPVSVPPVGSAPPGPPRRRRNRWFAALVISSVLLVVLVVAIVVVALNRGSGTPAAQASASPAGPVDACLIGRWKQTSYQHVVDLGTTDVGKRENLGKIKFTGGGKIWTIKADGSAVEDDSKAVYTGKTDDGRTVSATWEGRTEWNLTTKDGVLSYSGGEATTAVTINVDGAAKGRIRLEPNLDPGPYTCNGNIWRTSEKDSADDFSRYDRDK